MIELRNISKSFNSGTPNETQIFENFNLTLNEGDFVTIIGGNGSGKSTLVNIISGSMTPDEGDVFLNNTRITKMREHQRAPYFGRVFQDPMVGTASDMTVIENLALAYGRRRSRSLFRWSYHMSDVQTFCDDLKILDLGLEERLYQKVGLLSGGQRQALTLLMATMRNKPSHARIKRDYVRFTNGNKKGALNTFNQAFVTAKAKYVDTKNEIKNNKALNKEIQKRLLQVAFEQFDRSIRKFDLTKPVLLLDEHTAALDPKTAEKVLEITEKIVTENALTTVMITHNMKDAIRYGNRLIMLSQGQIIADVSGEAKKKLTIESLLKMFVVHSKNDMLPDSIILGD
ncbi:MAG: ATP-binding cassette domain-containing protein [Erysipelotrichia bacterium]|nr:ATP-binding cassette domain-containing protein [Erysipelotrichia bacterium]